MMQSILFLKLMQQPNITNEPINGFHASDGFTTHQHYWYTGDPTCSNRCRPVSFTEAFKHLIKYANVVNGQFNRHFV